MSKRQQLQRKIIGGLAPPVICQEFVMAGEPLLFSAGRPFGQRKLSIHHWERKKWAPFLKAIFGIHKPKVPIVIVARFFVSPCEKISLKNAELRREKVPAYYAPELSEYILALLEILYYTSLRSYGQVVKIDAEKYYSDNPRTILQFFLWNDYVKLQIPNTIQTHAKSFHKTELARGHLQPFSPGNAENKKLYPKTVRKRYPKAKGPRASNRAPSNTSSEISSQS